MEKKEIPQLEMQNVNQQPQPDLNVLNQYEAAL